MATAAQSNKTRVTKSAPQHSSNGASLKRGTFAGKSQRLPHAAEDWDRWAVHLATRESPLPLRELIG